MHKCQVVRSSLRHRPPALDRRARRVAGPALAALLLAMPTPAVAFPVLAAVRLAAGLRGVGPASTAIRATWARSVRLPPVASPAGTRHTIDRSLVPRSASALPRLWQPPRALSLPRLHAATQAGRRRLTPALRRPLSAKTAVHQRTRLARPDKPRASPQERTEGIRANAVTRTAQRLLLGPAARRLFRLPVLREVARTTVDRELAAALRLEARMLRQGNADPAALARASDAVQAARALLQTIDGAHSAPLAASRSSAGRVSENPLPYARQRAAAGSTARPTKGSPGLLSRAGREAFASARGNRAPARQAEAHAAGTALAPGDSTQPNENVGVL